MLSDPAARRGDCINLGEQHQAQITSQKKVRFRQIKVVIHNCLSKKSSLFGAQCANKPYLKEKQNQKKDWVSYLVF